MIPSLRSLWCYAPVSVTKLYRLQECTIGHTRHRTVVSLLGPPPLSAEPMVPGARDFPLLSPEAASNWSLARILASDWLLAVTLTRPLD